MASRVTWRIDIPWDSGERPVIIDIAEMIISQTNENETKHLHYQMHPHDILPVLKCNVVNVHPEGMWYGITKEDHIS